MSLNRFAKRRDINEPAIVAALEKAGCMVRREDDFDLLVGRAGVTYQLEVKTDTGKLTESQQWMLAHWTGHYRIVRTPEEALRAVGVLT